MHAAELLVLEMLNTLECPLHSVKNELYSVHVF